jgi:lipopolysaccharide transport system ATP-binding protein
MKNENIAIEVKNISKKYVIGEKQKYPTLRDKIMDLPKSFFKGPDRNEEFWALRNINLTIKKGEVVGIIGRNGAGKSTLLKILARITEPTEGVIRMRGKVASMLEVGTGFNPELTGRENIYLNGAILGMNRKEINKKFNEIVTFSGIEKFLDTPVKHYSSGMYVRLAFAVAAHLDSDILLIDEVLAVGDIEFQNKCLGKMEEVTQNEGRTIIFVSHNIKSVQELCSKCVLLEQGQIKIVDGTKKVVDEYFNEITPITKREVKLDKKAGADISFSKVSMTDEEGEVAYDIQYNEGFYINLDLNVFKEIRNVDVSVSINNSQNLIIFSSLSDIKKGQLRNFLPGKYAFKVKFCGGFLMPGKYFVRISIHQPGTVNIDTREDVLGFTISAPHGGRALNYGLGCVSLPNKWFLVH